MRTILDDLDHEWRSVASTRLATQRLHQWATTEPALAHLHDLRHVVSYLHRRHPAVVTDPILGALLRQNDDLAHRAVLQALVPGLGAMTSALHRHGDYSETAAIVVASCWQRICTYPIRRRPRSVARYLLLDARQIARRLMHDTSVFAGTLDPLFSRAVEDTPSSSEELSYVLKAALDDGVIDRDAARLIAATRIAGVAFDELAARSGRGEAALRKQRARAERRLARIAAA